MLDLLMYYSDDLIEREITVLTTEFSLSFNF